MLVCHGLQDILTVETNNQHVHKKKPLITLIMGLRSACKIFMKHATRPSVDAKILWMIYGIRRTWQCYFSHDHLQQATPKLQGAVSLSISMPASPAPWKYESITLNASALPPLTSSPPRPLRTCLHITHVNLTVHNSSRLLHMHHSLDEPMWTLASSTWNI